MQKLSFKNLNFPNCKVVKREVKGVKISQLDGEWKVETYLEKVAPCK